MVTLEESTEDGSKDVSQDRSTLNSNDLGGIFHPGSRKGVGEAKSGGFVAISQDDAFFAVKTIVGLLFFEFNSLDDANLFFFKVLVQEISRKDGGGSHEATVSIDQVFTCDTQDAIARGGDLVASGKVFMRNDTRWVTILFDVFQSQKSTLVDDSGFRVEAVGAAKISGGGTASVAAVGVVGSNHTR